MRALLAVLVLVAAGSAATAAPPSRAHAPSSPAAELRPAQAPQPSICCCRAYSRGWQYSWTPPASCQQNNGTCVSPDHC